MENRERLAAKTSRENELDQTRSDQKVQEALADKLGIPALCAGKIVIRDERNWRINEQYIEYCWLVHVSRSLTGWCWLFAVKFKASTFREIENPDALIQGVFTVDNNGDIILVHIENRKPDWPDKIRHLNTFELFDANTGIALDGIDYRYFIFAPNTTIKAIVNNPTSKHWKIWEENIRELGVELSEKSGSKDLRDIFL